MSNVIDIKTRLAKAQQKQDEVSPNRRICIDELSEEEFILHGVDGYVYFSAPFAMEPTLQLAPNVARVLGLLLIEQAALSTVSSTDETDE